jgi:hypothetical protein
LRREGVAWSAKRIPTAVNVHLLDPQQGRRGIQYHCVQRLSRQWITNWKRRGRKPYTQITILSTNLPKSRENQRKIFNQESRCLRRDPNRALSERKLEALSLLVSRQLSWAPREREREVTVTSTSQGKSVSHLTHTHAYLGNDNRIFSFSEKLWLSRQEIHIWREGDRFSEYSPCLLTVFLHDQFRCYSYNHT